MPRPIKRYENRKLYDTVAKRYISLEEIAKIVRAGEEVTVTDNATGADLTAETLTKVILEEQASRRRPLPPQFLHDLLRGSGRFVNRNLDLLIEASLRRLGPVKETLEELTRVRERLNRLEKLIESFEREEQHGDDTNGHTE